MVNKRAELEREREREFILSLFFQSNLTHSLACLLCLVLLETVAFGAFFSLSLAHWIKVSPGSRAAWLLGLISLRRAEQDHLGLATD